MPTLSESKASYFYLSRARIFKDFLKGSAWVQVPEHVCSLPELFPSKIKEVCGKLSKVSIYRAFRFFKFAFRREFLLAFQKGCNRSNNVTIRYEKLAHFQSNLRQSGVHNSLSQVVVFQMAMGTPRIYTLKVEQVSGDSRSLACL